MAKELKSLKGAKLKNIILSSNPCPICVDAARQPPMIKTLWRNSRWGMTDSKKRYCNLTAHNCHCILVPPELIEELPDLGKKIKLRGDPDSDIRKIVDIAPNEERLKIAMDRYNLEIGKLPDEIYDMPLNEIADYLEGFLKGPPPGVPPWKPVMTPKEAISWSKGSTIKKEIFHGTQAMDEIMQKGFIDEFIGSNTGNAGVFGKGHYFASHYGYAAPYGRAGEYLSCMVNTKKTCSWKTWQQLAKKHDFQGILDKQGMMKGPEKITKILKGYGYDSAIVAGSRLPNAEFLIFDAKNIVVIGGK